MANMQGTAVPNKKGLRAIAFRRRISGVVEVDASRLQFS